MDKALLSNATSADESPTPGYLLTEISRATITSYQSCKQLEDFLISRIKKPNSTIKYKCLVIIKHVCRTGRIDFKREMAQHVDVVKECLQYRGNGPDPLLGDEPNRKVREAAKEAMDAIFDSQLPTPVSVVAAANRIHGIGGGSADTTDSKPATISNSSSSVGGRFLSSTISAFRSTGGGHSNNSNNNGGAEFSSSRNGLSTSEYLGDSSVDGSMPQPSSSIAAATGYYNSSSSSGGGGVGGAVNGLLPNSTNTYASNNSDNSSSSAYAGGGGGGAGSSAVGMVGMGNPYFKDPRDEKSWMQRAQQAAVNVSSNVKGAEKVLLGSVSNAMSNLSRSGSSLPKTTFAGQLTVPGVNGGATTSSRGGGGDSSLLGTGSFHSNRGPNAFGVSAPSYSQPSSQESFLGTMNSFSDYSNNNHSSSSDTGLEATRSGIVSMQQHSAIVPDMPLSSSGLGRAGAAASDGQYEHALIVSLCDPSGLKPVLPEDALEKFLSAAPTLSPEIVGACLEEQLNSDHWQSRVKALLIISSLASTRSHAAAGGGGRCESHVELWKSVAGRDLITGLINDPKASVRTQALKTLQAFRLNGNDSGGDTSSLSRATTTAAVTTAVSLLDFGDDGNVDTNNGTAYKHQQIVEDRSDQQPQPSYSILRRQEQLLPTSPANNRSSSLSPSEDLLSFSAGDEPVPVGDSQKGEVEDIFAGMSLTRPVAEQGRNTATATPTAAATSSSSSSSGATAAMMAAVDARHRDIIVGTDAGGNGNDDEEDLKLLERLNNDLNGRHTNHTYGRSIVTTSSNSSVKPISPAVSVSVPVYGGDLLSLTPTSPPITQLQPQPSTLVQPSLTNESSPAALLEAGGSTTTGTGAGTSGTGTPDIPLAYTNTTSMISNNNNSNVIGVAHQGGAHPTTTGTTTVHPSSSVMLNHHTVGLPSPPRTTTTSNSLIGTGAYLPPNQSQSQHPQQQFYHSSQQVAQQQLSNSTINNSSISSSSGFSFLSSSSTTSTGPTVTIDQQQQGQSHSTNTSFSALLSPLRTTATTQLAAVVGGGAVIAGSGGAIGGGTGIVRGIVPQTQQKNTAAAAPDSFSFVSDMMKVPSSCSSGSSRK